MGTVLSLLYTQTLHLPFSSARGFAWVVTRRGQPFSIPASRLDFARAMYSAPLRR
jgi:hypothetical protein